MEAEEVTAAIAKLKNGKATDICGNSAKMLKGGGRVVVEWLHSLINLMWLKGEVPADWRKAVIVPTQEGSKVLCNTYRGISLLSIPCKVYVRVLEGRVRGITESKIRRCRVASDREEAA